MSISEYNGGSVIAMAGKDCVAFGSDCRLGSRFAFVTKTNLKFHQLTPRAYILLSGLETDNQTVLQKILFRIKLFRLQEEREMPIKAVSSMISNMLYEHRFGSFFVEPIVVGLNPDGTPFINGMDSLGAGCSPPDFLAAGTAQETIMGVCESLWKPDLDQSQLFERTSQAFMAALDRDGYSGLGAWIKVLSADGTLRTVQLKSRMD